MTRPMIIEELTPSIIVSQQTENSRCRRAFSVMLYPATPTNCSTLILMPLYKWPFCHFVGDVIHFQSSYSGNESYPD